MDRPRQLARIEAQFDVNPVVAILGPRQCGKTTLARAYAEAQSEVSITVFDLEDPTHLAQLENPKLALQSLEGVVILDEIQRAPLLFEVLRVLVDRPQNRTRFLILGSASRDLIQQSSETLAGRISHLELTPFSTLEVGLQEFDTLWCRGGYPRSFLARDDQVSSMWRRSYITTFLERDIPALGISIPAVSLRRFWMMVSHYHGQRMNYSELGRSFGIADTTVRRYLDVLSATFVLRQLQPWYENINKRQVKAPKIYVRDSGILHALLGIETRGDLSRHPKLGASWEGFAIEEILQHYGDTWDCFFWAAHSGAEIDLLLMKAGRRLGFEIKYTDSPRVTGSMRTARDDLSLDELLVVHPGDGRGPLAEGVEAVGLRQLLQS